MSTKNNYNHLEHIHLIGKKINGYQYKHDPDGPLSWTSNKNKYVGIEGVITEVHTQYPYIKIAFSKKGGSGMDVEWWMLDNHEQHLIKDKTEDELFGDIYELLKKI